MKPDIFIKNLFQKESAKRNNGNSYLFICFLVIGLLCLFSCENNINEVNALNNKGVNTEEAINIESYLSVGGKTKARLTAPLMISSEKDTTKMVFPNTLHVIFYDDSTGLPSTYLFAKHAVYYKSLRKVYLYDSIVGINIVSKDTLLTDELWWNQNTEMLYGSKPTIESNPSGRTYGDNGFSAKQDFSEVTFENTNRSVWKQDSTLGL